MLKQRSDSLQLANNQLNGTEVVLASGQQLGGQVSTRSAVFGVVSRQKKPQTPALLSATLMHLLTILRYNHLTLLYYSLYVLCLLFSVTYCHFCWDTQRNTVPMISLKQFHQKTTSLHHHRRRRIILRLKRWWGAQQAQWNPPRN